MNMLWFSAMLSVVFSFATGIDSVPTGSIMGRNLQEEDSCDGMLKTILTNLIKGKKEDLLKVRDLVAGFEDCPEECGKIELTPGGEKCKGSCAGCEKCKQKPVPVEDITKWSEGTKDWPDNACNPTNSFGMCNTNDQKAADAWASYVCKKNGFARGRWTGKKKPGCAGPVSVWCSGKIPCSPTFETKCQAHDQSQVEIQCFAVRPLKKQAVGQKFWSKGTGQWPDNACNPTNSFGRCNSNDQKQADEWAKYVCEKNGFLEGKWTGQKKPGCAGQISVWCTGQIPCKPTFEHKCQPQDQSQIEVECFKQDNFESDMDLFTL
jgi:hypothetical protein